MSASERQDEPLPEQAEALLDGWPAPERSALEWEDLANATVGKIRETSVGSTNDDLLAPPLPKVDGEGEALSDDPPAPAAADEPGLLAIAKAAVTASAADEARNIARAGLMAAGHGRQSRPPAPPVHAHPGRRRTASNAASLQGQLPKSVGAFEEARARSEVPAASNRGNQKIGSGPFVTGALLALAAGVALYVAVHRGGATAVVATTAQESHPAPPVRIDDLPSAGGQEEAAKGTAEKPKTLALDDLKEPERPSSPESAKVVVPSASAPMSLALRKGAATLAAAAPSKKPSGAAAANAAPAVEPAEQQAAASSGAKESARQMEPARASDQQALPTRPSVGAIQGAIGSVMLGARSCLAGQESGSKATVIFGSDGRVKTVTVGGPAAGTPAEGCLRSALGGARVPPFADPDYTASFTVRPP